MSESKSLEQCVKDLAERVEELEWSYRGLFHETSWMEEEINKLKDKLKNK